MGKSYTSFAESKLGQLINKLTIILKNLQQKYTSADQNQKNHGFEYTYTANQITHLLIIIDVLNKILPLYEKGQAPGLSNMFSLLKAKSSLLNELNVLQTAENTFYNILLATLKTSIEAALKQTKIKQFSVENTNAFKEALKESFSKQTKGYLAEIVKIPDTNVELLYKVLNTIIDDISYVSCNNNNRVSVEFLYKKILNDYEGKYLNTILKKFELRTIHPMMFDVIVEAIFVLEEIPGSLEELVSFLNPASINVPGFITYKKPAAMTHSDASDASDAKESYLYNVDGETHDMSVLFERYLPVIKEKLLHSIKDYFDHYSETHQVRSQQAKASLIKKFVADENKSATEEVEHYHNECLHLIATTIDKNGEPEQLEALQQLLNNLTDMEKRKDNLLNNLSLNKDAYLEKSQLSLAMLLPQENPLYIKLDNHKEQGLDVSYYNQPLLEIIVVDEGKNSGLLTIKSAKQVIECFYSDHVQFIEDSFHKVAQKRKEIEVQIGNVYIGWRQSILKINQFQNKQFQDKLQRFIDANMDSTEPDMRIEFIEKQVRDNDAKKLLLEKQSLDLVLFEETLSELAENSVLPLMLQEHFSTIKNDIENCYLPSKQLLAQTKKYQRQMLDKLDKEKARLTILLEKKSEADKNEVETHKMSSTAILSKLLQEKQEQLLKLKDVFTEVEEHDIERNIMINNELQEQAKNQLQQMCDKQAQELDSFNNLATEAFAKIALVQPERNAIIYQAVPAEDMEAILEFLTALIKRYEGNDNYPVYQQQKESLQAIMSSLQVSMSTIEKLNQKDELNNQYINLMKKGEILAKKHADIVGNNEKLNEKEKEISLINTLIILLAGNERLNKKINSIISENNENTPLEQLYVTIKQVQNLVSESEAEFTKYKTLLSLLKPDAELLSQQIYIAKIEQIAADIASSELRLNSFVALYYSRLVSDLTQQEDLLEDGRCKLAASWENRGQEVSFDDTLYCLQKYNELNKLYNYVRQKLQLIALIKSKDSLEKSETILVNANDLIELLKIELFEKINEQITPLYSKTLIPPLLSSANFSETKAIMSVSEALDSKINDLETLPITTLTHFAAQLNKSEDSPLAAALVNTIIMNRPKLQRELVQSRAVISAIITRINARELMVDTFKVLLENYLVQRHKQYSVKDKLSSLDNDERALFIKNLQLKLITYRDVGNSAELLNFIHFNKANYPGQKLQPLLNRLILAVKAHEKLIPGSYSTNEQLLQPEFNHDDIKPVLTSLTQTKPDLAQGIEVLYQRIDDMKLHGENIAKSLPSAGEIAINLAIGLEKRLDEYLLINKENMLQNSHEFKQSFRLFERDFKVHLHSQDDFMSNHRARWKPILGNILLAISSLGIAIGVQLIISKFTHAKRATFFFDDTKRLQNVAHIDEALQKISPAA